MDCFRKTSKLDAAKKRLKKRRCQTVVLGDRGVGKTSLIYAFATGSLPKDGEPHLPSVMPPLLLNKGQFCIVDTAINRDSRTEKSSKMEIKLLCENANFEMICYACNNQDTFDEVIGFWLPKLRSFNINAPIAVVGCKEDLLLRGPQQRSFNEMVGENQNKFPEVEVWMECSAARGTPEDIQRNTSIFNGCFITGLYPTAPLYDQAALMMPLPMQPLLAEALRRIFDDHVNDGPALTRLQIMQFEEKYFDSPLSEDDVNRLLQVSSRENAAYVRNEGLTFEGFCGYSQYMTSNFGGEFLWRILRLYEYDDNLKLKHHSWLGRQKNKAKKLILAIAQNMNQVTGYWLYKNALGLDAPVITLATGFDADALSFGPVLSYILLGVVLGVVLTVYQTVTLSLTAHLLIVSKHKILGSLTVAFMILPSLVMALLWSILRGDMTKGLGMIPGLLSSGLKRLHTDLRDGFRRLGRMLRDGCSSLWVEISKCGFVTHVFLFVMLPAILYALAVFLTLFSVCFGVLTLGVILLVLLIISFLCVFLMIFIPFFLVLGLFMDTYLTLQVLASPCLAMEAKYADRYMNLRGFVNTISHSIPQTVLQVVLFKLNVIPTHKVLLSFIGVVIVIPYTLLVFYFRARYFCRQRGIPTSLQVYLVDDILKPLEIIPNSNEIRTWTKEPAEAGLGQDHTEPKLRFFWLPPTAQNIDQEEIIAERRVTHVEIIPENTVLPVEVALNDQGHLPNNIIINAPLVEEAERDAGSKELPNVQVYGVDLHPEGMAHHSVELVDPRNISVTKIG